MPATTPRVADLTAPQQFEIHNAAAARERTARAAALDARDALSQASGQQMAGMAAEEDVQRAYDALVEAERELRIAAGALAWSKAMFPAVRGIR